MACDIDMVHIAILSFPDFGIYAQKGKSTESTETLSNPRAKVMATAVPASMRLDGGWTDGQEGARTADSRGPALHHAFPGSNGNPRLSGGAGAAHVVIMAKYGGIGAALILYGL
jgi:hypothetical protein